jgi:hypothetical protein
VLGKHATFNQELKFLPVPFLDGTMVIDAREKPTFEEGFSLGKVQVRVILTLALTVTLIRTMTLTLTITITLTLTLILILTLILTLSLTLGKVQVLLSSLVGKEVGEEVVSVVMSEEGEGGDIFLRGGVSITYVLKIVEISA